MTAEGLALYNWRTKNSMSQQQAASWLGVSYQTVYNIERGRTKPSKKTLRKLCNVVGDLDEQAAEEVSETSENGSYVPFTECLAKAYPELQKKFDNEAKAEETVTPKETKKPDLQRLIGFFEGVAAATGIDMSKQVAQLEGNLL